MKVLITGASGQVGHELVIAAQNLSISYLACDRFQLDITDAAAIDTVFSSYSPDIVINAAAYTAVDAAEDNADVAYSVNRDGVEKLALACKVENIPLLHISTDFVFDGEKAGAYEEDDQTNPLSVYGASKLAGEEMLREIWEKHIILRTSWVYGVQGNNFVKTMLRLMRERDQLQVVDDQWGCPTSAQSIAVTLLEIARAVLENDATSWGTYHFCAKGRTSWFEFANEVLNQANQYSVLDVSIEPIASEEWICAAQRPRNSELDCKKITSDFRITRTHWRSDLPQIVAELIDIQ